MTRCITFPLLEKKINALDQAAPLAKWDLPPEFQTLRRLMEARMIKAGRREYVQVLRLLETFDLGDLHVAVKTALRMGTIGFDAIRHLVLCGRVASITGQARSTLTRENGQPTDSNLAQPSSVILLRARTPICASVF